MFRLWPRAASGALDGRDARPHEVDSVVKQLLFAQLFALESQLQYRRVGGAVAQDQGRAGAGRQGAHGRLRGRGDLRGGSLNLGSRMKEHLDDRDPRQALALRVLDVVDGRDQEALEVADDALFHFLRR
jgi:hypothetical protein